MKTLFQRQSNHQSPSHKKESSTHKFWIPSLRTSTDDQQHKAPGTILGIPPLSSLLDEQPRSFGSLRTKTPSKANKSHPSHSDSIARQTEREYSTSISNFRGTSLAGEGGGKLPSPVAPTPATTGSAPQVLQNSRFRSREGKHSQSGYFSNVEYHALRHNDGVRHASGALEPPENRTRAARGHGGSQRYDTAKTRSSKDSRSRKSRDPDRSMVLGDIYSDDGGETSDASARETSRLHYRPRDDRRDGQASQAISTVSSMYGITPVTHYQLSAQASAKDVDNAKSLPVYLPVKPITIDPTTTSPESDVDMVNDQSKTSSRKAKREPVASKGSAPRSNKTPELAKHGPAHRNDYGSYVSSRPTHQLSTESTMAYSTTISAVDPASYYSSTVPPPLSPTSPRPPSRLTRQEFVPTSNPVSTNHSFYYPKGALEGFGTGRSDSTPSAATPSERSRSRTTLQSTSSSHDTRVSKSDVSTSEHRQTTHRTPSLPIADIRDIPNSSHHQSTSIEHRFPIGNSSQRTNLRTVSDLKVEATPKEIGRTRVQTNTYGDGRKEGATQRGNTAPPTTDDMNESVSHTFLEKRAFSPTPKEDINKETWRTEPHERAATIRGPVPKQPSGNSSGPASYLPQSPIDGRHESFHSRNTSNQLPLSPTDGNAEAMGVFNSLQASGSRGTNPPRVSIQHPRLAELLSSPPQQIATSDIPPVRTSNDSVNSIEGSRHGNTPTYSKGKYSPSKTSLTSSASPQSLHSSINHVPSESPVLYPGSPSQKHHYGQSQATSGRPPTERPRHSSKEQILYPRMNNTSQGRNAAASLGEGATEGPHPAQVRRKAQDPPPPRISETISREESKLQHKNREVYPLKPVASRDSATSSLSSKKDSRLSGFLNIFRPKHGQQYSADVPRSVEVSDTGLEARVKSPIPSIPAPMDVPLATQRTTFVKSSDDPIVFTPFRYLAPRRQRTVSMASMDAVHGTAANTVVGSPTASMHSQYTVTSPPAQDPVVAAREWREKEAAELMSTYGSRHKVHRPGVVFDVAEDPAEERPRPRPIRRTSTPPIESPAHQARRSVHGSVSD